MNRHVPDVESNLKTALRELAQALLAFAGTYAKADASMMATDAASVVRRRVANALRALDGDDIDGPGAA